MKNRDAVLGLLVFLLAIFGIFESFNLPVGPSKVPSSFYPLVIFFALGLAGFVLLLKGIYAKEKQKLPKIKWRLIMPIIVLLIIYVTLLNFIGYLISTVLFFFVAMLLLGVRNKWQLISVPLSMSFFIYLTFEHGFRIMLP